jgi:hypothetical protein
MEKRRSFREKFSGEVSNDDLLHLKSTILVVEASYLQYMKDKLAD